MEKLLTVVIPVYNMEKYISQCLDSLVIDEIMDKVEVLVVLDGSTDRSGEIASEYVKKYPGTFRIIEKENGGHGSAINTGVDYASGRFLKVLDSDDWVNQEAFCHLVKFLQNTRADIVWTNYYWVYEHTGKTSIQKRRPFLNVKYGKEYVFGEIAHKTFIKMHSMTIRTKVLRNSGKKLDEHCYYVDVEFVMYPIPQVKTIVFLDEFVYMYRLGRQGQSMSLERMRKNYKNHERVLNSLLSFYDEQKEKQIEKPYLAYIARGVANILSSHFKIYLSFPCSSKICGELRALDSMVRQKYPEIYANVHNTFVWAIRKSGYLLYYPGHFVMRLREMKYEL